jgi:hypothetical protein
MPIVSVCGERHSEARCLCNLKRLTRVLSACANNSMFAKKRLNVIADMSAIEHNQWIAWVLINVSVCVSDRNIDRHPRGTLLNTLASWDSLNSASGSFPLISHGPTEIYRRISHVGRQLEHHSSYNTSAAFALLESDVHELLLGFILPTSTFSLLRGALEM